MRTIRRTGIFKRDYKRESKGRHRNTIDEDLLKVVAAERAEKGQPFRRFRAHDLRHKFAVDYLRAGGDIYRLGRILGHASVKTTEIYLDFVDLDVSKTVSNVQRFAGEPNDIGGT